MLLMFKKRIFKILYIIVVPLTPCPKGEQSLVIDTMIMLVCIFSTQAAVKTISDGVCTLRCDVTMFPSHTHKVGIDPCFFRNSLHA